MARKAVGGPCRAPGCNHRSSAHGVICSCCRARLGVVVSTAMSLAERYKRWEHLAMIERDGLETLAILGPNPRPHVHRGPLGVPQP